MKLGYSEFIDKHNTKVLLIFVLGVLLLFISPILYSPDTFRYPKLAMGSSFYCVSVAIIRMPLFAQQVYNKYDHEMYNSFSDYFRQEYNLFYPLGAVGSLIFWFTIVSIIILLVQHFKHKKITKPLLYLPCALYIIYVIIYCAISGVAPFVGFYLAIILEALVILYCAGFQRFPSRKPREHKPTDKERIAELERQVAELQKDKDNATLHDVTD